MTAVPTDATAQLAGLGSLVPAGDRIRARRGQRLSVRRLIGAGAVLALAVWLLLSPPDLTRLTVPHITSWWWIAVAALAVAGSFWAAALVLQAMSPIRVSGRLATVTQVGAAALIADGNARSGGYLIGPTQRMTSPGYAVVSEEVVINTPGVIERLPQNVIGELRVTVTPLDRTRPVFVGVASLADADRYLAGVSRTTGWSGTNDNGVLQQGTAPAAPPQSAGIWEAQASGVGQQSIVWTPRSGDWTLVVMNADATAAVTDNIRFDATLPWLRTLGGVALGVGLLFLAGGAVLVAVSATRASRTPAPAPTGPMPGPTNRDGATQ